MESRMMDQVKVEKEEAIKMFNRCRGIGALWRSFHVLLVLLLISFSSARVVAVLRNSTLCFLEFSAYIVNHHVVFLIWNAIVVVLFVLCSKTGANISSGNDDCVKHSAATQPRESSRHPSTSMEETPESESIDKVQMVMLTKDMDEVSHNDDVGAAIEKAAKRIKKFQKTQSTKLKQEIAARRSVELGRSETETCLITMREEIETLSSDEFRRRVDAFIDEHWGKRRLNFPKIE